MEPVSIAKLWLAVKPIKRIKERRRRKKLERSGVQTSELVELEEDESMDKGFIWEIVKGTVRHSLTAAGVVFVNAGVATSDEVNMAVGALMTIVGFGFSVYRKWRRSRAV